MTEPTPPDRREVQDRLVSRATTDPQFRRQLLEDPQAAVRDELGVSLPADVTVTVVEETPHALYLVLPQGVEDAASSSLTDAELGDVAGGVLPPPGVTYRMTCQASCDDG